MKKVVASLVWKSSWGSIVEVSLEGTVLRKSGNEIVWEQQARVWLGRLLGVRRSKDPRSQGAGWTVFEREVSKTVAQRKTAKCLYEEGTRRVCSNSTASNSVRFSERKEEQGSGGVKRIIISPQAQWQRAGIQTTLT